MGASVWLPKGFEFLAGYPTPVRKRKLLLPLQVIVDDSGGPNQTYQVMGGLFGEAEDWAEFSNAWQDCLDTSPKVRAFHMAKVRDGDWHGLSQKRRNDKLRDLARVIADPRFRLQLIVTAVQMRAYEGFRSIIGKLYGEIHSHSSYFWVYQLMIMAAAQEALERAAITGIRERFKIIFDENGVHGPEAKAFYPRLRDGVLPDAKDVLPYEPQFENDEKFPPLQAADMIAWFARRSLVLEKNPYAWLGTDLGLIPVSRHCKVEDEKRLADLLITEFGGTIPIRSEAIKAAFDRSGVLKLNPVAYAAHIWANRPSIPAPRDA